MLQKTGKVRKTPAIYLGHDIFVRKDSYNELKEIVEKAISRYAPGEKQKNPPWKTDCNQAADKGKIMLFPPKTATWGIYSEGVGRPFHTDRYTKFKGKSCKELILII
jgi:hypothetical protein